MGLSQRALMAIMSGLVLWGTLSLVQPPPSQADVQFGGFKKILKKFFPPCGPGTKKERFVVSKDGNSVCDNKTGLWWEQRPSSSFFDWANAIQHCENLTLSGKTWRLPTLQEIQWDSLIDYSVDNQAMALNDGPFDNVQSSFYWSASELVGSSFPNAWLVNFGRGTVDFSIKRSGSRAWCVSGGQDAHGH